MDLSDQPLVTYASSLLGSIGVNAYDTVAEAHDLPARLRNEPVFGAVKNHWL